MTQPRDSPEAEKLSTEELSAEIDESRKRIEGNLNRLADRLAPESLVADVSEKLGPEAMEDTLDCLFRSYERTRSYLRKRPLSVMLLAVGIATFLFESSRAKRDE